MVFLLNEHKQVQLFAELFTYIQPGDQRIIAGKYDFGSTFSIKMDHHDMLTEHCDFTMHWLADPDKLQLFREYFSKVLRVNTV